MIDFNLIKPKNSEDLFFFFFEYKMKKFRRWHWILTLSVLYLTVLAPILIVSVGNFFFHFSVAVC
jgi:hypothetical protein